MNLLAELEPIQWVLLSFVAAFGLSYVGMRMLWSAVGATGTARGLAISAPIAALAIIFGASGAPGMAIALCMAAAVLMLTLGMGVAGVGRPEFDYTIELTTPPTLRMIGPLAACACAIGFNGRVTLFHLIALAIIGGLTLWTAAPHMTSTGRWQWRSIGLAAALLAVAVVLIVSAGHRFQSAAGAMVVTPLVVLLAAPAILLSIMGLLSTESQAGHFASAGDTVAGFVMGSVGVAMPAAIAVAKLRNLAVRWLHSSSHEHLQPVLHPLREFTSHLVELPLSDHAVIMPVATWRIDSLLLLVTTVILMPVSLGKIRLGRLEGAFLVALYLIYAAIASRAGLSG